MGRSRSESDLNDLEDSLRAMERRIDNLEGDSMGEELREVRRELDEIHATLDELWAWIQNFQDMPSEDATEILRRLSDERVAKLEPVSPPAGWRFVEKTTDGVQTVFVYGTKVGNYEHGVMVCVRRNLGRGLEEFELTFEDLDRHGPEEDRIELATDWVDASSRIVNRLRSFRATAPPPRF